MDPVPVDRLTLVDVVESGDWAVELSRPVLVQPGEQMWVDGSALVVQRSDGRLIRHEGDGHWICR